MDYMQVDISPISPPHFGKGLHAEGTMLRNKLLPAPNVSYSWNVMRNQSEISW
jgi:hypothetical protein